MGCSFMRFIKRMRAREFLLVVCKLPLLFGGQHAEFLLLDIGDLVWSGGREVVVILELRECAFFAESPGEVVVVSYEAHVVGVDCAKGGKAVADDGEERDEDVVNYVDDVVVPATDVDPAFLSCCQRFCRG
jgi:hypothetical protein